MDGEKNIKGIPCRVIIRYTLLQIPSLIILIAVLLLVRHWFRFPDALIWILAGLWAIKDVVLFPFVWRSYDQNLKNDRFSMIGKKAIVTQALNPSGHVRLGLERWRAEVSETNSPVPKGQTVRILRVQGLKLHVEPEK
ncbi:MAG: NfeD family protein [Desulfobacterales bacterium]|nr:NfeD family protein [Desulfobacterales bacterium]